MVVLGGCDIRKKIVTGIVYKYAHAHGVGTAFLGELKHVQFIDL